MRTGYSRIYTRCGYCNNLTFVLEECECEDCGYNGVCHICNDTLEDEWRRSTYPTVCANVHCQAEWNDSYDRR